MALRPLRFDLQFVVWQVNLVDSWEKSQTRDYDEGQLRLAGAAFKPSR